MNQSDKLKVMNLPENLKSKLLRFEELKEAADLRRKTVRNSQLDIDKEITDDEQGSSE